MPEPDDQAEQELGPRVSAALHAKAGTSRTASGETFAWEARRRVRKRRQSLTAAAAAVVVAVAIGGVWSATGGPSTVASTSSENASAPGNGLDAGSQRQDSGVCPAQHQISSAANGETGPRTAGLDLSTPVTGLLACRYRVVTRGQSGPGLLGSASFDAAVAQQVVAAISGLPERNPELPVFKCTPETARPKEAIVLRFTTGAGIREVWVQYDGCSSAGFFTGSRTYGLYAAPLKLFLTGAVRPAGGTYLDALDGW